MVFLFLNVKNAKHLSSAWSQKKGVFVLKDECHFAGFLAVTCSCFCSSWSCPLFTDFFLFSLFFVFHQTQVQASTTLSFLEIISKLPQIGVRGLYKGSIPTVLGQFSRYYMVLHCLPFFLFLSFIHLIGFLSILQPWPENRIV